MTMQEDLQAIYERQSEERMGWDKPPVRRGFDPSVTDAVGAQAEHLMTLCMKLPMLKVAYESGNDDLFRQFMRFEQFLEGQRNGLRVVSPGMQAQVAVPLLEWALNELDKRDLLPSVGK